MDKDTLLHLITIRGLELGLTERQVSTLALGDPDGIRNWRRKSDPLFSRVIAVLKYLDIPFEIGRPLSGPEAAFKGFPPPDGGDGGTRQIRLWGDVVAGGSDQQYDGLLCPNETSDPVQLTPPPFPNADPAAYLDLFAIAVRGHSMSPIYNDGDLIYLNSKDPLRNDPQLLIGRDCAVTIKPASHKDSEIYLKRLRWPDNLKTGFFNLESINQEWPTLINMSVEHVIPVRFVRRKVLT